MRTGARITPASKALATPPMIGGVDYRLVLVNMMGTILFTLLLKILYLPLLGYGVHFVFKQINKDDPMTMKVLLAYKEQGGLYVPFSQFVKRRFDRPNGFGRGLL